MGGGDRVHALAHDFAVAHNDSGKWPAFARNDIFRGQPDSPAQKLWIGFRCHMNLLRPSLESQRQIQYGTGVGQVWQATWSAAP
jgi:hypothetical protein